ncbi:MAG: VanZ family protein [Sedimentisphaerales bacterium]
MRLTQRQKITLALLSAYWVVLLISTHIPIPKIVYQAGVSDKWLHFLAYMNLVFLLWFSIRPDSKVSWRNGTAWLILLIVIASGGLDELTQPYFGRTCDLYDFLTNVVAIIAGLLILTFMAFWQALPAMLAITIFGLTNLAKANLSNLAPISDVLFHIFAYAGFTICWIQFMRVELPRITGIWRLLLIIDIPVCLLLVVKTASLLSGRHFATTDLLFAILGICGVVIISYLTGFIQFSPKPDLKGV